MEYHSDPESPNYVSPDQHIEFLKNRSGLSNTVDETNEEDPSSQDLELDSDDERARNVDVNSILLDQYEYMVNKVKKNVDEHKKEQQDNELEEQDEDDVSEIGSDCSSYVSSIYKHREYSGLVTRDVRSLFQQWKDVSECVKLTVPELEKLREDLIEELASVNQKIRTEEYYRRIKEQEENPKPSSMFDAADGDY